MRFDGVGARTYARTRARTRTRSPAPADQGAPRIALKTVCSALFRLLCLAAAASRSAVLGGDESDGEAKPFCCCSPPHPPFPGVPPATLSADIPRRSAAPST